LFGDNWGLVEEYVGTRNRKQIENYGLREFGGQREAKSEKNASQLLLVNKANGV